MEKYDELYKQKLLDLKNLLIPVIDDIEAKLGTDGNALGGVVKLTDLNNETLNAQLKVLLEVQKVSYMISNVHP